jgi:hypothetical protein
MKVTYGETHVLGSGGLEEATEFRIRTSPHAFKMLSSTMYSDKPAAVLREIGCNAADAHIEAGCPQRPFEVKLPNQIDPQFYIRDHGPGLADKDVKELYTTYFASTKQNSNEQTGAFGLGSKSPFSYTDSFTVMSCHGGKKRIYTAHINAKGVPVIAQMGETTTDTEWKSGIQIGFPVKPDDFRDFQTKAERIFRHFNPVPVVHGAPPIKPMKLDADFADYAFIDKDDPDAKSGVFVIMGNVRYPLNMDKLNLNRYSGKNKLIDYVWDLKGLILRFKIGDLQVSGSREELQYDTETQKVLKDRLEKVLQSIATEVHTAWRDAKTWADQCEFKELAQRVGRGIQLEENLFTLAQIKDAKDIASACRRYGYMLPAIDEAPKASYSLISKDPKSQHFRLKVRRPLNGEALQMDFIKDIKIVWGAEDRSLARVREAFRKEELEGHVLLVAANTKDKGTEADVEALYKQIIGRLPGVEVKDLMTFTAPPIIRTSKKGVTKLPDEDVLVDGVKTKLSEVDDERKIYVPVSIRSNWGNIQKVWLPSDGIRVDRYHRDRLHGYIKVLNDTLKLELVDPVEITLADVRRLKMAVRPEWVAYQDYLRIILEDKANLDGLKALVKDDGYSFDLNYSYGGESGILENLVRIRHKYTREFKTLEPILTKHNILDVVQEVYKRSLGHSGYRASEPEVLTAYKEAARIIGLTIETPEYKIMTLDVNNKFSYAAARTYNNLLTVMSTVPTLFPQAIDELLSKGTSTT